MGAGEPRGCLRAGAGPHRPLRRAPPSSCSMGTSDQRFQSSRRKVCHAQPTQLRTPLQSTDQKPRKTLSPRRQPWSTSERPFFVVFEVLDARLGRRLKELHLPFESDGRGSPFVAEPRTLHRHRVGQTPILRQVLGWLAVWASAPIGPSFIYAK